MGRELDLAAGSDGPVGNRGDSAGTATEIDLLSFECLGHSPAPLLQATDPTPPSPPVGAAAEIEHVSFPKCLPKDKLVVAMALLPPLPSPTAGDSLTHPSPFPPLYCRHRR